MRHIIVMTTAFCMVASLAFAQAKVSLKDPVGDDDGPGTYTYPTDPVYKPGSFDMTSFEVEEKGGEVIFRVGIRVPVEDPWDSKSWGGNGFSLQFIQVYIDTKPDGGFCEGLPGLNIQFKEGQCYEKVVLISPQPKERLHSEVQQKAGKLKEAVVIPKATRARGKVIEAVADAKDLGGPLGKGTGFQVIMQSNEGYPDAKDLLTRKVNEYAGQHRFGGGSDYDCDPHVIDILVPPAKGGKDEIEAQHKALAYTCDPNNPDAGSRAKIPMVYP